MYGKETKTPEDYYTASDFRFSITQDKSEVTELAKKVKHININNEQVETYIKLVKRDTKSNKIVSLSSATFGIKATENIYDRATDKLLYAKGQLITQKVGSTTYSYFTTNSDNVIVPAQSYNTKDDPKGSIITPLQLPVGSYEVFELKIPFGFLQLDKNIAFTVKNIKDYDTDVDGDFIKTIDIHNEQPTGTLIIDKFVTLRENVDTSLVDISDLSGISFKLEAKENIVDMSDGSLYYKKGDVLGIYNLQRDGSLKIDNLPIGEYLCYEWSTLPGLVLNGEMFEIKFTQNDTVTKIYTETREIENKTTIFEFSKTDITGDEELERC